MHYRAASALGTLLSYVMVAGVSPAAAEEGRPESTLTLEVLLTVAPSLPEAARAPFLDEVNAIWKRQGVTIEWLSPTEWLCPIASRRARGGRLRVLVFPKSDSTDSESNTLAVAELLRQESGRAVAIAYIAATNRIVDNALPRFQSRPAAPDHYRLGLVLGRAVAHEIGHYLLNTNTHARRGLMRPRFDSREFSDLRPGAFTLDPDAARWLKDRFLRHAGVSHVAQPARFSYAH
jgi:hypothetical protein